MKKASKFFGKGLSLIMAIVITASLCMCVISVSAAFSGEGKGTQSNPYLITTAKQVDEIRNNLSAHYKLANNIDMSSIQNFVPIGKFNKMFTGSLTCDTDEDGKPKYIIKNLTVNLNPKGATLAEKYSGFDEDGDMCWAAAFFSYTKNATFKNIVVLDAKISSTVQGNSQMNSDWSTNPGQSIQQSAAVLIGTAINTKIESCGVSGTVNSASNSTGGLVGILTAEDGKTASAKNSYALVDVTSTGVWTSGGFCAGQETFWGTLNGKVTIDSCYYKGTFSGSYTNAGAFIGGVNKELGSKITNCWADGTVITSSSGCFYGTDVYGTGGSKNTDVCENTYTLATIKNRKNAQTNKRVTNNNWITDAVGGLEIGFAAGSKAEINAAFKGLDAWNVSDDAYPQLKNVHPITSSKGYEPLSDSELGSQLENTDSKQNETSSSQNTSSSVTASGESSEKEENASASGNTTASSQGASSDSKVSDSSEVKGDNGGTAGNNDSSEQDTSSGDETLSDSAENSDNISTVVDETLTEMSTAEKILIIVLSVIAVLLIAATVFVIVRWFVLIKQQKMIDTETEVE